MTILGDKGYIDRATHDLLLQENVNVITYKRKNQTVQNTMEEEELLTNHRYKIENEGVIEKI